jgi:hypothetical protein
MAPKKTIDPRENTVVERSLEATSQTADGSKIANQDTYAKLVKDITLANLSVVQGAAKDFDKIEPTVNPYTGPYADGEPQPKINAAKALLDKSIKEVSDMSQDDRLRQAVGDLSAAAKDYAKGNTDTLAADGDTIRQMTNVNPALAKVASKQLHDHGDDKAAKVIDDAIAAAAQQLKGANIGSQQHADDGALHKPAAAGQKPAHTASQLPGH